MVCLISASTSTHNHLLDVNSREFDNSADMMGIDNPFSIQVYQEVLPSEQELI